MSGLEAPPTAAIFGCAGPDLSPDERRFFRAADPLGFILFERNCGAPGQVRDLVAGLRDAVGRAEAPVLIDQEGGRVARLGAPHWRVPPAAARFGDLARGDPAAAEEAARLNARLIAHDLHSLGIDVDCAPVADVRAAGGHDVIGDRAFAAEPGTVTVLARATCEGLLEGGVAPVLKHVPGHGRARVDSHYELPVVETDREALRRSDFAPFIALAHMPWAMTAHVVYAAVDPERPATTSRRLIAEVIRGEIGFDGLLLSDDLSMEALSGSLAARAGEAWAAGCDVVLHCNGDLAEMAEVAGALGPLRADTRERLGRARALARPAADIAPVGMRARLEELLSAPLEARA